MDCFKTRSNPQNKRLALEVLAISNKNMLDKPSIKTVEGESLHGMVCDEHLPESFPEAVCSLQRRCLSPQGLLGSVARVSIGGFEGHSSWVCVGFKDLGFR